MNKWPEWRGGQQKCPALQPRVAQSREPSGGTKEEDSRFSAGSKKKCEPTAKIDCKDSYHILDAVRYVISYLNSDKQKVTMHKSPIAKPGLQNL